MPALINALRRAFLSDCNAPPRTTLELSTDTSLLLMPAWRPSGGIGVKIATVNRRASPAVQASYLMIDGVTGLPRALLDGAMLTSRRTAAASALAAGYLARDDSATLLIAGTGTLVPHLIEAHCSVRPITRVSVWGRDHAKAKDVAQLACSPRLIVNAIEDLDAAVASTDIICAATLAERPLIKGKLLRPGSHVDLVGAFRPDMCEADSETFAVARVFVDTRDGALEEAGDLIQAIAAGALQADEIEDDLAGLCAGRHAGRGDDHHSITLFKSVGSSIEDLAAAELVLAALAHEASIE